MLDICLLGTGGTIPLQNRWLTSLMVRYQGHALLIDCGEGTQIAAQKAGLSLKPIDCLLLTHLHADHVSGLPGLLLSMGNMGKSSTLHIYGPIGTKRVVSALQSIAMGVPFPIEVHELEQPEEEFSFYDCRIKAFEVNHRVTCYGYSVELDRAGKFQAHKAQELAIPLPYWSLLQKGESVQVNETTYLPAMVLGPARRGLKLTYCTDTRPTESLVKAAANSQLFICEGMYGDDAMRDKVVEKYHMLFSEAASIAAQAGGVGELWLTHYSPALPNPKAYREVARAHFAASYTARDGWKKQLIFEED